MAFEFIISQLNLSMIKSILLIITVSFLTGLGYNYFNQDGIPLIYEKQELVWEDEQVDENNDVSEQDNNELPVPKAIELEKALNLFESGAVFLDARSREEYKEGHITNAVSLPYDEFDTESEIIKTLDKNEPLVAYCGGTDCDLSVMLGNKLFEAGFNRVFIFYGGWKDWQQNNLPTETGSVK